jgi:hypothetical protein
MIHQFTDRGGAEKGRKKDVEEFVTGSQEADSDLLDSGDEIDPAEFFDPEEFGVTRSSELRRHE